MGTGDLAEFQMAGKTLFSFGLVKGTEGNLSSWDGERLRITRTGSSLMALGPDDVLEGTLDEPPAGASSDLAIHVAMYRERGRGAVAHDHPPGSVPEGWVEGRSHGSYAFAATVAEAVRALAEESRGPA